MNHHCPKRWLLAQVVFLLCLIGCSKGDSSNNPPPPPPAPTISSISTNIGAFGTVVTIAGSSFSSTISDNVVKFNGVTAVIQSATATEIVAVVPKGAGTGPVTVAARSQTATGENFRYVFSATVSTLAGSTDGYADGAGTSAQFKAPTGLTVDDQGNVFVIDNYRIRKITSDGVVTTFAGTGLHGSADGLGTAAEFAAPSDLARDHDGNIYVTDSSKVRKITPQGEVTTLAGSSVAGYADGTGAAAMFYLLAGIACDADGNVYVVDASDNRIRKISPLGVVTTFAGFGLPGAVDGPALTAKFFEPIDIVIDSQGNMFVTEFYNAKIRKITNGVVSTYVNNNLGYYLTVDNNDNLFASHTFASINTNVISQIFPGIIFVIAGHDPGGFADGPGATMALFFYPIGIAVSNSGIIYVADSGNDRIRKIVLE